MTPLSGVRQGIAPPGIDDVIVHVVDDEAVLRSAVARLLRSHGFHAIVYASGLEFVERMPDQGPGCVLLDLSMPGMSGLELQEVVTASRRTLSVVFVSGNGDIPASVKAMKAGAVDFLTKPFEERQLIEAVRAGIRKSRLLTASEAIVEDDWKAFQSLTPREKQVCLLVTEGLLNKQIAGELGPTEKTIKLHRAGVMKKLRANSVADMVKLVERLRRSGRIVSD